MQYLQLFNDEQSLPNTRFLWAIASGAALMLQPFMVGAQQFIEVEEAVEEKVKPLPLNQSSQVTYDSYILGPGDGLHIELLDLPEFSGSYTIGPDGTLYLPRLRGLYIEGLTVEELSSFLTEQFSTYVRDPQVFVQHIKFRPIRIYVRGEVKRAGFYTLGGSKDLQNIFAEEVIGMQSNQSNILSNREKTATSSILKIRPDQSSNNNNFAGPSFVLPTVFDAIKSAQGITPYSNLSKVQVTRKRPIGLGGGRIRTNLNILSLITKGDETQNIRLLDGDVVNVSKSDIVIQDQLLKAGQTNLSPEFMSVYVSGRVDLPGAVILPQGAVLNQALAMAGGPELLRGRVEFIRFSRSGEIERRRFPYNPRAAANTQDNPVLITGDLINVNESLISASFKVIDEVTAPFLGFYSLYSIFNQ
ncbi:polysaccharide biosynthesis/export family protein [Synechococcus sp. AH-551-C10]|nr:polysaccharide biosynthesis/export family protein [Synechococcus sp. AH-551-C10]MDB4659637.1 polysaccharide biosynthesis/export family protein [Synechococcus sp. AH-551-C10]